MNSYYHAKSCAKKWGGTPEDYIEIHEFIDSSKKIVGDVRHRSIYHHTEGIWLCQRIFGRTITVGAGPGGVLQFPYELTEEQIEDIKSSFDNAPIITTPIKPYRPREVPVRLIAELHIEQDLGWIPSPADYIRNMELNPWMGGPIHKEIPIGEFFK